MFCGECGKKISDEAKFCPYCGSPTELVEESQSEYEEVPDETVAEEQEEYQEVIEEVPDEEVEYEEEIEYEEEYEDEQESNGSGKKAVIILLLLIAIVVAVFFIWKLFFADTKNDNAAATTTAEVTTTEDGDDTVEDTEDETAEGTMEGHHDGLPEVYADDSIDYSKPLSPKDYEVFESDEGYSFAYPKHFYNEVQEIDGGYSFTGDDGVSAFEIYREENPYGSVSEAIDGYYDSAYSSMNVFDEIIYAPESGKMILAAKNSFDSDIYYYYLVKADEEDVYVMKVTYPYSTSESKKSENEKNYMVDCMYRYCSFSGGTYKPRTYTQFKNDDMGSKK